MKITKRLTILALALLLLGTSTIPVFAASAFEWYQSQGANVGTYTANGTDATIDATTDVIILGPKNSGGEGWNKDIDANRISFTFNIDPKIQTALEEKWYMIFAFRSSAPEEPVWSSASNCVFLTVFSDGIQLRRWANGKETADQVYLKGTFNDKKDHHVEIEIDDENKVVKLKVDDKTTEMKVRLLRQTGGMHVAGYYSKVIFKDFEMKTVETGESINDNTNTNTDVNTDKNVDTSTDTNTDDNTNVNTDTNIDDNTDTNTDVNTDKNTDTSIGVDMDENTDTNTNVDTDVDTDTNTDINTDTAEDDNGMQPILIVLIVAIGVVGIAIIGFGVFIVLQSKKIKSNKEDEKI